MRAGWKIAVAAFALVAATGGALMLLENVPQSTGLVGVNVLALGLLGFAVSSLGAWLARKKQERRVPRDRRTVSGRLIFVVRRDRRDLYESFRRFAGPDTHVDVVLDRRLRPRDTFDVEVLRRGWSVARVPSVPGGAGCPA